MKEITLTVENEVEEKLRKIGRGDLTRGIYKLINKRYDNVDSVDKFVEQFVCEAPLSNSISLVNYIIGIKKSAVTLIGM